MYNRLALGFFCSRRQQQQHCLIDNNAVTATVAAASAALASVSLRSVFCVARGVCVIFFTHTHTRRWQGALQRPYCPIQVRESCCALRVRPARKKDQKKLRLKNVVRTNCHLCLFFSFLHALQSAYYVGLCAASMCAPVYACV